MVFGGVNLCILYQQHNHTRNSGTYMNCIPLVGTNLGPYLSVLPLLSTVDHRNISSGQQYRQRQALTFSSKNGYPSWGRCSTQQLVSTHTQLAVAQLGWVCPYHSVVADVATAQTYPQKPELLIFTLETGPEVLLLTCSPSWELQQRPQTTVGAIKIISAS